MKQSGVHDDEAEFVGVFGEGFGTSDNHVKSIAVELEKMDLHP